MHKSISNDSFARGNLYLKIVIVTLMSTDVWDWLASKPFEQLNADN